LSQNEIHVNQNGPSVENRLDSLSRLFAIDQLEILDAPIERSFKMLVELANRLLDTPVALISIVTDKRQFFVRSDGLGEPWASHRETPLSHSFCQHVVTEDAPLIVMDSREHPLVCGNLAITDLNVISYLGVPLRTDNDEVLGSFCVIDSVPRKWTAAEISTLNNFAQSTSTELNLRVDSNRRKSEFEKRLRYAQKLEAMGQFSAGVAHDFNNALGAIQIYCDLIRSEVADQPVVVDHLNNVARTIGSAAEVVQQLTRWSRLNPEQLEVVLIEDTIEQLLPILQAAISGSVQVKFERADNKFCIKTSVGLIQQILMNLFLNADYALRGIDGEIKVCVADFQVDENDTEGLDLPPGQYVQLSVADNGAGIPAKLIDRIADPYFTTKPVGSGTGLGLWTAFGIVKEHGGHVKIVSEQGQGTVFRMYFPRVWQESTDDASSPEHTSPVAVSRDVKILVVDDVEAIAEGMKRQLMGSGYRTECTTQPTKALDLIENDPQQFHLVIADQTMPGLAGTELLSKVKQINPEIRTILCSGNLKREGKSNEIDHLCCKPYELSSLVRAIDRLFQLEK
jgi:signal transduction histidine kinase